MLFHSRLFPQPATTSASIANIGREFMMTTIAHECSHQGREAVWDFLRKYAAPIAQLSAEKKLPSYKTVRRRAEKRLPPIQLIQVLRDLETDETTRLSSSVAKAVDFNKEQELYMEAAITVRPVQCIVADICMTYA